MRFLEKVKVWLEKKKEELKDGPQNLKLLLDHHYRLAQAEGAFLSDLIRSVKEKDS